jgi:hypothetical protein
VTSLTDSFNRADSSTTLGNLDTGQAWAVLSGTWGISSNTAYQSAGGTQNVAVVDVGSANFDATIVISTVGADGGFVCRATDDNNYLLVTLGTGGGWVYKRVAGSFSYAGSGTATTPAIANGDVVRIIGVGDAIRVIVNDAVVAGVIESFNNTATKVGLRDYASSQRVDSFTVVRNDEALIGATDSFNRADDSYSLWMTDSGKVWQVLSGAWGTLNHAGYNENSTPSQEVAVFETHAPDFDLTAVIATAGYDGGFVVRATDDNNYILIAVGTRSDAFKGTVVYKRVSGGFTNLEAPDGVTWANGDTIRIVASGNVITVYRNGSTLCTFSESFNATATLTGVRESAGGSTRQQVDSIAVTPLPVICTPATLATSLSSFAPAALAPVVATPGMLALATALFAPAALAPVVATPGMLALATALFAPNAPVGTIVTPGLLALVTSTFAPLIQSPKLVTPDTAALVIVTFDLLVQLTVFAWTAPAGFGRFERTPPAGSASRTTLTPPAGGGRFERIPPAGR